MEKIGHLLLGTTPYDWERYSPDLIAQWEFDAHDSFMVPGPYNRVVRTATNGVVRVATNSAAGATRTVQGGIASAEAALRGAERWLGKGYMEIAPGVFRSAVGRRQFRMTDSDLLDPKLGPHVHFESIAQDGRTIVENSHVLLGP